MDCKDAKIPIWFKALFNKTKQPHDMFSLFSQEVSIFIFDKKKVERSLVRPKRNTITEFLKTGVSNLKLNRHARILPVLSGPEDCSDSLAFVSEPLLGSLANILRFPINILFLGHNWRNNDLIDYSWTFTFLAWKCTLPCRIVPPGLLLGRVFKKLYFGATVSCRAMETCQIHLDKS